MWELGLIFNETINKVSLKDIQEINHFYKDLQKLLTYLLLKNDFIL